MATNQSATAEDLRDELIAGMPPGFEDLIDLNDPNGPGPLFTALGQVLAERGTDQVDDLRDQLSPLTCSSATLAEWEGALALDSSRIARGGGVEQRRAQVVSRLREWGPPTLDLIRRVVYSYLGYSSPNDVVILESDRDALRAMHTYRWSLGNDAPVTASVQVKDGGTVADGGVVVDLSVTTSDLSAIMVEVEGPDGTLVQRTAIGATTSAVGGREWEGQGNPGADDIFGIWGIDGIDPFFLTAYTVAWTVGASGAIMKWDGTNWTTVTSPVATNLNAVWGTSASNVWAVGDGGVIIRWNGTTWATVASGVTDDLRGVWGTASGNIWAVGAAGTIIHWNGTNWATQVSGTTDDLYSIWGSSTADVWAVGESGRICWWNGTAWTTVTSPTGNTLLSVWGSSPWDAWACGVSGTLIRFDVYGAWKTVTTGLSSDLYAGCLGSVLADGSAYPYSTSWIVGDNAEIYYWSGSTLSEAYPSSVTTNLYALWRHSSADFFAAGASSEILRMAEDGTARIRVWFPEFVGAQVDGKWDVTITTTGSAWITDVELFTEGIGLDTGGADGRGSAALWWGVMFEPAKSSGTYDLDAARLAVRRLTMACRWSNILRRSSGAGALAAGDYGTIPADPGALPAGAVPG